MTVNIMVASLLAKNMISYPLGYNFSCSYGVPLAIWETHSINKKEQSRLIDVAYHVSAVKIGNLGDRSVIFNSFVNLIIFLVVLYLLQKGKEESRWERGLRKCSLALVFSCLFPYGSASSVVGRVAFIDFYTWQLCCLKSYWFYRQS